MNCISNHDREKKIPRIESSPYFGTFAASILIHALFFVAMLTWSEGRRSRIPAEKIILVDITMPELQETKIPPAVAPAHIPVPQAPRKIQGRLPPPTERTAPVPVAPLDKSKDPRTTTGEELTVPRKVAPQVSSSRDEHAGPVLPEKGPPPPPVAVHSPPRVDGDMVKIRYLALLRQQIEKHKDYPLMARKFGREGICTVRCILDRDGSVRSTRLVGSSGQEILDKSAMRAVGNAGRFPIVPDEIKGDEISFDVPISYRLTGN